MNNLVASGIAALILVSMVLADDPAATFKCTSDGDFALDPSACAHRYITCANSKPIVRDCAGELKFDTSLKVCLQKESVAACRGQNDADSVDCRGKNSGPITNPAQPCSEQMWVCSEGHDNAFVTECPAGLFYDIVHSRCDYYSNVQACSGNTITTTLASTISLPNVNFDCSRKDYGNYVDPSQECSSIFYTCSPVGAIANNCPTNTFYYKEAGQCDYKQNIPACGGSTSTSSTLASSVQSAPLPSPTMSVTTSSQPQSDSFLSCKGKTDGNYAAGQCLSYFWQCSHGDAFKVPCAAPNLVYDRSKDACLDRVALAC